MDRTTFVCRGCGGEYPVSELYRDDTDMHVCSWGCMAEAVELEWLARDEDQAT